MIWENIIPQKSVLVITFDVSYYIKGISREVISNIGAFNIDFKDNLIHFFYS